MMRGSSRNSDVQPTFPLLAHLLARLVSLRNNAGMKTRRMREGVAGERGAVAVVTVVVVVP